mmetsp:Transcript_31417/g.45810  ORF Transcript_31417/g.45810 Transcript_31417/m.45810 type:complete len:140 (-) Transcript_31417:30-449(-)
MENDNDAIHIDMIIGGGCNPAKNIFGSKIHHPPTPSSNFSVLFHEAFEHTISQSIELVESFPDLSRSHSNSYEEAKYGRLTFYYSGRCGRDRGDGSTCLRCLPVVIDRWRLWTRQGYDGAIASVGALLGVLAVEKWPFR